LSLFHHCLDTGFHSGLHLLKYFIRIEGRGRPRLGGWSCRVSRWIWCLRCGWLWSGLE
jgi:hypothetical protein